MKFRKMYIFNLKKESFLFVILLICAFLSDVKLFSIHSFEVTPFYVMLIIVGIKLILMQKFIIPYTNLIWFCLFILIHCLFTSVEWGIDKAAIKYLVSIFLLMIFYNIGEEFKLDDWLYIFQCSAIVIIILTYINTISQYKEIFYYLDHYTWLNHPAINTLSGGGVNLEATWVALLAMTFIKNKYKWFYWIFSALLSALYVSRTGIITNTLCAVIFLLSILKTKNTIKIVVSFILSIPMVYLVLRIDIFSYVIARLINIENDTASLSRLDMWEYFFQIVAKYPFGVGVGNASLALERISGQTFIEDNLHNLFFQYFCDLGIIGGFTYIFIVIRFIILEYKNIIFNPFVAMLCIYIIDGFVQFKGAEAIMLCILCVYLTLNQHSMIRANNQRLAKEKINI